MKNDIELYLQVVGWSQTITHGEKWPSHQLRVIARTFADEEIEFSAADTDLGLRNRRLRNMPVHLNLSRGQPEKPPERGIGVLAYYPERPADLDNPGSDAFVGGWFWLPEALYDEIWTQARDHHYDECVVELEFGPVEFKTVAFLWDTARNRAASITRAGVRFERKIKLPLDPDAPQPEPPKKRGWFSS